MKIISLNCWCGKLYNPLVGFLKSQAGKIDIFSFQEIVFGGPDDFFSQHGLRGQLFERIREILKGYKAYKALVPDSFFGGDDYHLVNGSEIGQTIFVKEDINVLESGSFLAYPKDKNPFKKNVRGNVTGRCQYVKVEIDDKKLLMVNVHGLWQPVGKNDTKERLEQSKIILKFVEKHNIPAVVIGDFNLQPKTQSIEMLSQRFKNLIAENGIKTTRSRFYFDMEKYKDYIADYAFVDSNLKLEEFVVLKDEVSDHLPLLLEINP